MADADNRLGDRRGQFKAGADVEEIRRKREDEEVQLRKAEKADLLAHKRRAFGGGEDTGAGGSDGAAGGGSAVGPEWFNPTEPLDTLLPKLSGAIMGNDNKERQLEAVVQVGLCVIALSFPEKRFRSRNLLF